MRNILLCVLATTSSYLWGNAQTQSIIYDATAIMNAKYNVNALLVPKTGRVVVIDALTGDSVSDGTVPPTLINAANSNNVIFEILRRNAGLPVGSTPAQIQSAYATNPFLNTITADAVSPLAAPLQLNVMVPLTVPIGVGATGQSILGNLVNGTADFLIKRAQEEISISVFVKLKQFLDRYPEFNTLFPRTYELIKPIEAYEYNRLLIAFKAAIKDDLDHFISRISLLYNIPRYQVLNRKVPSLSLVFSASTIISELSSDAKFAGAVYTLSNQPHLSEQNNYTAILKSLSILSNSILDKSLHDPEDISRRYIDKEYVGHVTHNNATLIALLSKIYLGLIWQHTNTIAFYTGATQHTFAQLLAPWATSGNIQNGLLIVQNTITAFQALESGLQQIKTEEHSSALVTGKNPFNVKRLQYYSQFVSQLLDLSVLFVNPANANANTRIAEIKQYLPQFTDAAGIMIKDFQAEEYNLGISKLEQLLSVVSNYLEEVKKNKAAKTALENEYQLSLAANRASLVADTNANHATVVTLNATTGIAGADADITARRHEFVSRIDTASEEIEQINYQDENRNKTLFKLSTILKYINLLAAISKAENSAVVEELLETYALPAGSSRIKKVSPINVAVNAYVGMFFGRSGNQGQGFTNKYGFTAPIGFAVSTGLHKAGSLSLFAGLFDIGGTIRYKLDNDGQYHQDISLAGIVSPSIQIAYGFPFYLPFTFGMGSQWLSPVTSETNKIDLKSTFNAFIGVDIPLFNLNRSN